MPCRSDQLQTFAEVQLAIARSGSAANLFDRLLYDLLGGFLGSHGDDRGRASGSHKRAARSLWTRGAHTTKTRKR